MKKAGILLAILLFMSCSSNESTDEFKYKGHEYIYFYRNGKSGFVHSPDCKKCLNYYD